VIGGHIEAAFASAPSVISNVQGGKVRALAVSSAERIPIAPDVPTIAEAGIPNFDVNPWWGILAPAGLSPAIVAKINADVGEALRAPDLLDVLAKQGVSPLTSSPAEFATRCRRTSRRGRGSSRHPAPRSTSLVIPDFREAEYPGPRTKSSEPLILGAGSRAYRARPA
jgi:tripartite-type tricarboxylate transporter receptor subunit TctC